MSEAVERALPVRVRSALFEIASVEAPPAPRRVLKIVCALLGLLLAWCLVAELDIVAVAEGRLVPQTYVKVVQPSDGGIVREILVEEGAHVQAGQVLLRLDPTENAADSAAMSHELALQQLQIRRIDAELSGEALRREAADDVKLFYQVEQQLRAHQRRYADSVGEERAARERATRELAAAREVLSKLEQTLPSYQRSAEAFERLARERLVGTLVAEERGRDALERGQDLQAQRATVAGLLAAVAQSEKRLAQLRSTYENELHETRMEALSKVTQLEQSMAKLDFRRDHLELRAPQEGTVKELMTTTEGAVVQPGTVLLTLVPAHEPLLAEVSIRNEDIGFVREGQPVRLKLATFPFQKYGMLEGVVQTVSADSQVRSGTETSEADLSQTPRDPVFAFKALVRLKEQQLSATGAALPLAAGMQLSAEIIEGRRTVMEYLLSPVQRVVSESGRER